jgi:NAD(P)-dependent dehydrogenase (short-subunit alcohol dehydrogenase family)
MPGIQRLREELETARAALACVVREGGACARSPPLQRRRTMGMLEGKVAIITGAGGGIGREHALLFAREGAKVVVNDLGSDRHGGGRGGEMADKVVAEIKAAGGEAVANYDSVAGREGADGLIWSALNKFGKLDIAVNNAGILRDKTILNMSEQDFDLVIDVHLRGTFLVTQAAGRVFKVQGKGGRIINTTSLSGLLGNFGQGNYAAAKGGIYSLTRTASMEFQRMGVTVNAIAPVALTRMTQDLTMFKGLTPEKIGPQYIAPVAAFLASDLAADITGTIVGVQGLKIFLYKMIETEGATREGGPWSPAEIKERWTEISK